MLAEFSELGLLSASGAPEPVRYETNTTHRPHFRCRLCLRIFDLLSGLQNPEEITDARFTVERVDTRAEGICGECNDYDAGLRAGARTISRSGPAADRLAVPGVAAATFDGPLGGLLRAATPQDLTRVAFEGHRDFDALRARARSRGSQAARRHLADAAAKLRGYFAGSTDRVQWVISGVIGRARAAINRINPLRRPPVLHRPRQMRLGSRPRLDHGCQPDPQSSRPVIASPGGSRFQRRSSAVLSAGTGWKVTRPPPMKRYHISDAHPARRGRCLPG
jgi:hypothetical protein